MATPRSGYKEHSAHCALFTPIPTTGLDFPLREAIRNRCSALRKSDGTPTTLA
jgi:hypothetical protein